MKYLVGLGLSVFITNAALAEDYLCIPTSATGYAYNKSTESWNVARFNVTATKYLLKRVGTELRWTEFGKPELDKYSPVCEQFSKHGTMRCGGIGQGGMGETVSFRIKA